MAEKLKIAIIGLGARGTNCFGRILTSRDDVEIAAFCDLNPVRAKAAAEILGINPPIHTSMEEMTRSGKFDGVIITTPDSEHRNCAIGALKAGWNVLIDKPLATNVKDGRDIIKTANETGKIAMIGFNLRHNAVLKQLKKIIDEGTLGKVFLAENREFYDGGRTYMARWNRLFSRTGGLWIHKASHDFDIFNWLLGFPKPLRVASFAAVNAFRPQEVPFTLESGHEPGPSCNECYYQEKCSDCNLFTENELKQWGKEASDLDHYVRNLCLYLSDKDNHDNGIAMVEYENNIKVSLFETFIGQKNDRIYTIAGDRGIAEVSLTKRTITITPRWKGEIVTFQVPEEAGGHGGADPNLVDSFCKVIRGEIQPGSTVEHGLLATALGQAAEMSRREHRMVDMSELI